VSRIVVVGAGGNIASHLVAHLARARTAREIALIDPDTYDETNLWSQDIRRRDVGRPKAVVQARRLREIDPTLVLDTFVSAVEAVPLGALRADVLLACLDSRAARRAVNTLAWRLGVPWVDAGVHADGRLARVNVHRPGPEAPCYLCAWDELVVALVPGA
jgi:molybdopterin/thiamine biosynthesis adenylyltransferase